MINPGWAKHESPFHAGERAIQSRLNVQARMDKQGRRIIRDYLPDQFRQFFAQLPYLIVGTVDADKNPWASILVGEPGFLSTPDERHLTVASRPLFGDPLNHTLAKDCDIGFLGIELQTRRRNRLNGTVIATHADGFEVQVQQSFGNCPQYIQARTSKWDTFNPTQSKPRQDISKLSAIERAIIVNTDTFFIATAYQAKLAGAASGVDVSHRGGNPGFVRVDNDSTLTIPDFSGNFHFNTFGNLELNPRAGLLFIDFSEGDLLYLTGQAEVIWEGKEIAEYEGAERLLRFHLERGHLIQKSLPLRWSAPDFSPFLNRMGTWSS